jgi:hypothetical protein
MARRLHVGRRQIPLDRLEEYRDAWERLRQATVAAGGRGWLFRSTARDDHFLEFLEWEPPAGATVGLLEHPDVALARAALDGSFGGDRADEWEEAETGLLGR